ncbi:MAG: hypothetical protein LBB61_02795 [Treponema sp.]|jgi:hypothetical protein|nr:hypothetical protein [Treponema sp.]
MAKLHNPEEIGKNILADAIKNPPVADREVVFRYSHERRLEKAPRSVQDFNKSKGKRPAVFATLTGSRSNIVLLMTILVFCALVSIITRLISDKNAYKLDGNAVTVSAMRYEGNTFVVIKKQAEKADAYTGAVDIAISSEKRASSSSAESGETPPIFTSRFYFMPDENEEFRISAPLEIEHVLILMQTETEQVVIKTKAE